MRWLETAARSDRESIEEAEPSGAPAVMAACGKTSEAPRKRTPLRAARQPRRRENVSRYTPVCVARTYRPASHRAPTVIPRVRPLARAEQPAPRTRAGE